MRTILITIGILLAAESGVAQSPHDEFIRMANDSIERADRTHRQELEYQQMRQDYIRDTQQAIRQEREDNEALQKLLRKNRRGLPPYNQNDEEDYERLDSDF